MKLTRMYTGDDGETHFEDVEIELLDRGPLGLVSKLEPATGLVFRETGEDYELDWHTAPRRQLIVPLEGAVEIETGDGGKRRFGPGDLLLAEDTTGRGHISRAVEGQRRRMIFVTLD